MTLKIISTTEVVFEGDASMVSLPGVDGRFTVLDRHATLIASLVDGDIVYRTKEDGGDKADHNFSIRGGIASIDNNVVSVCIY